MNSTLLSGPLLPISTSKPGFGVAHSTCTPPGEKAKAAEPPTRWKVFVVDWGDVAGTVLAAWPVVDVAVAVVVVGSLAIDARVVDGTAVAVVGLAVVVTAVLGVPLVDVVA